MVSVIINVQRDKGMEKMKMTMGEIKGFADKFLRQEFGLRLEIPIKVNGRLTRSMGRFRYNPLRALDIELAKVLVMYNTDEVVLDTLKHELVHYALYELGQPFDDSDAEFIEACQSRGIGLTKTGTYNLPFHLYRCDTCDKELISKTKRKGHFLCKACKSDIKYVGKELRKIG